MCKKCNCGKKDRGTQFAQAKRKPTLREQIGEPTPNGLGLVTDATKRQVSEIMEAPDEVITEYFRADDGALIETNVAMGSKRLFCIGRGTPIGAFVAFKQPKPLTSPKRPEGMLIGWSKRHPTDEPLVFTREDAKRVAITRGMVKGAKLIPTAPNNDIDVINERSLSYNLPYDMEKQFASFIARVKAHLNNKKEED